MSKYMIYPSLLDAYQYMVGIGDYDERMVKQEELIAKINRVPMPTPEAAARGTALNVIIDSLIDHNLKQEDAPEIAIGHDAEGDRVWCYGVDGFNFGYADKLIDDLLRHFDGATAQYHTQADIKVGADVVTLYGYPDYIMGDVVKDLKTTARYTVDKYFNHWQHIVYPYCLVASGMLGECEEFQYVVAELKADRQGVQRGQVYVETYYTNQNEREEKLREFLGGYFLPWLESVRERITDKKIFCEL